MELNWWEQNKTINNEQTIAKCSLKNIIIRMNLYILFI